MTLKEENIRLLFGLKVRQLRMDKHLSLVDLARVTGISVSYLNEIEKGKKYPKANKIALLAKAMDVSYDWLVSLQLSKKLSPIAELIKSDLLTRLPLEIFGIEPADLIDIISNTPSKISAFISTLIEIARNYNIGFENFYFSVLRSYQEMYENYFEDLEEIVGIFIEENPEFSQRPLSSDILRKILEERYHYVIDIQALKNYPDLKKFRSVLIPQASKNLLLLNNSLSDTQMMFTLGREIGYCYMKIKERAYTSSWIKIESFEQLLNNFKASYFSGALLIPQKAIREDISLFIENPNWETAELIALMHKYQASPEMFMHRLTSIMPKFFGLNQLFFLRFNHKKNTDDFDLDKELHLAGLYNPHGNMLHEDYCRRWISLNILKDLDALQNQNKEQDVICQAQRSQYIDSDREYLCISLARANNPTPNINSSVTIGFLMSNELKEKVKFWNDSNITIRKVGVTCQRCSATDCAERISPSLIYNQVAQSEKIQESLEKLIRDYQQLQGISFKS